MTCRVVRRRRLKGRAETRRDSEGEAVVQEKENIDRWSGGDERDWPLVKEDEWLRVELLRGGWGMGDQLR